MQIQDSRVVLQKYKGTNIKVDSFFLKRTNLVSNQTLLKLGEYNLMCVPAYLGFEQAQFLVVLTPSEVDLFSKFSAVTNTLVLAFGELDTKELARFHIKVSLLAINPLERKNVCMLIVQYKTVPAELVSIMGIFLDDMESRNVLFENLSKEWIEINAQSSHILGYNNYAELLYGSEKVKVRLVAIHSKQAKLVLAHPLTEWEGRKPTSLKLYFRAAQFSIDGVLEPEGFFTFGFSNDLLAILEDFRFKESVILKKLSGTGPQE